MLKQIGQTFEWLKKVSQHIKAIIEEEFSESKKAKLNVYTLNSSNENGKVDGTSLNFHSPSDFIGGELTTQHILAKMGNESLNKSKVNIPEETLKRNIEEKLTNKKSKLVDVLQSKKEVQMGEGISEKIIEAAEPKEEKKNVAEVKENVMRNINNEENNELYEGENPNQVGSKQAIKTQKIIIKVPKIPKGPNHKMLQTMNDYKFILERHEQAADEIKDKVAAEKTMDQLRIELAEALEHWKWTQKAYDQALGFEQVEYCIYRMMAAEQKYRMILLKARALQVEWSKVKGELV